MQLKVLGSSSKGNCYILDNGTEAIMIDCGVKFDKVKQSLNFQLRKVVGCLLTHEHGDHSNYLSETLAAGIKVHSRVKTFDTLGWKHHNMVNIKNEVFQLGGFKILPFDVQHDAADPIGFLINHDETGNVLFITDTFYVKHTFRNLHNIIVEANYSKEITDRKRREGYLPQFLNDRIIKYHMSLETCCDLLKANDLSQVNNIVLIHLSDGNSDAAHFQTEIKNLTGKTVHVADAGVIIENFNKTPF